MIEKCYIYCSSGKMTLFKPNTKWLLSCGSSVYYYSISSEEAQHNLGLGHN